ncbi:hypothetical protein D3C78_1827520 [compost metagenome]
MIKSSLPLRRPGNSSDICPSTLVTHDLVCFTLKRFIAPGSIVKIGNSDSPMVTGPDVELV